MEPLAGAMTRNCRYQRRSFRNRKSRVLRLRHDRPDGSRYFDQSHTPFDLFGQLTSHPPGPSPSTQFPVVLTPLPAALGKASLLAQAFCSLKSTPPRLLSRPVVRNSFQRFDVPSLCSHMWSGPPTFTRSLRAHAHKTVQPESVQQVLPAPPALQAPHFLSCLFSTTSISTPNHQTSLPRTSRRPPCLVPSIDQVLLIDEASSMSKG